MSGQAAQGVPRSAATVARRETPGWRGDTLVVLELKKISREAGV